METPHRHTFCEGSRAALLASRVTRVNLLAAELTNPIRLSGQQFPVQAADPRSTRLQGYLCLTFRSSPFTLSTVRFLWTPNYGVFDMGSVIKKRRKKMRKHKYEKMRKKMRHERRKRGK
jgi:hypothetical protein